MAANTDASAWRKLQNRTTRALYKEVMPPNSFALDQAARLPGYARDAAIKLADSPLQLADDESMIRALVECGEKPSRYAEWLDGMRVYANNRRQPI